MRWPLAPAPIYAGREALHPQRPENVDHQRRLRGSLHGVRESRRREVHGVLSRARLARRFHRQRRAEDGHQGQLHHGRLFRQREGAGRERSGRDRARPHHRVQHFESRPAEAGPVRARRMPRRSGGLDQVREGAQGVRQIDLRIRHDPAQDRRNGDPHVREREHDLSRGRRHRSAARRIFMGHARRRKHHAEGGGGVRDGVLFHQSFRVGNARLRGR